MVVCVGLWLEKRISGGNKMILAFAHPGIVVPDLDTAIEAGDQITAQERAGVILQIEEENVPAKVDRIVAERVPILRS